MELEVGDSNVILDFLLLRLWMREGQLHSTIDETIRYWSAKGQSYIELLRYAEGVVVRSLDCFLVRLWEREGQLNPMFVRAYQKAVYKE